MSGGLFRTKHCILNNLYINRASSHLAHCWQKAVVPCKPQGWLVVTMGVRIRQESLPSGWRERHGHGRVPTRL